MTRRLELWDRRLRLVARRWSSAPGLIVLALAFAAGAGAGDASAGTMIPSGDAQRLPAAPNDMTFSPDGRFLVATTVSLASSSPGLSVFSVSPSGVLTSAGPPTASYDSPSDVEFSPDGHFVAAANTTSSTVSMYAVSPTGKLTQAAFPTAAGDGPGKLAFSRDGKLLAVTVPADHAVMLFSVAANGVLTPVGSMLSVGGGLPLVDLAYSGDGKYLAISSGQSFGESFITMVSVASDGALAIAHSPTSTGQSPASLMFSSDGYTLTATNPGAGTITTYSVVYQGGLLATPFPRSLPLNTTAAAFSSAGLVAVSYGADTLSLVDVPNESIPTPAGPRQVLASPDGKLVAVRTIQTAAIAMYTVLGNERLVQVGVPTSTGGDTPESVAFGVAGGRFVVGHEFSKSMSLFKLSAQGVAQPSGAPVVLDGEPYGLSVNADGSLIATTNPFDNSVSIWQVPADGPPAEVGSPTHTGSMPLALAFSPTGRLLLVSNVGDSKLMMLSVSPQGLLTPVGPLYDVGHASGFNFNNDGTLVTVAGVAGSFLHGVSAAGILTPLDSPSLPDGTGQGAFSPDGKLLAVPGTAELQLYDVSSAGMLTQKKSYAASFGTYVDLAWSPDGKLLAAASMWDDTVLVFRVSVDGTLTPIGTPTPTGDRPVDVKFDPTGQFVTVVNSGGNALSVFPLAAPELKPSVVSGPPGFTKETSATFTFDANYAATFECKLDSGTWKPCAATATFSGLSTFFHFLHVRAVDALGNPPSGEVVYDWMIDHDAPPPPELTGPVAGAQNLPDRLTLSWKQSRDQDTGIHGYPVSIDGGEAQKLETDCDPQACQADIGPLSDGSHTWAVAAVDGVGNTSWSSPRAFTVDASAPGRFDLAAPGDAALIADQRPTLSWQAAVDAGTGVQQYEVTVDEHVIATLPASATSYTPPAELGDGDHTWKVVARDGYGYERATAQRSFTVDTTPPTATLRASPARFVAPFQVQLDAGGSEDPGGAIARYEFDLDGDGTFETPSPSPRVTTTLAGSGGHALAVRVVDRVGLTAVARDTVVGESVTGKGFKEAFATINDGAEFTRSLDVALTINPPPRSGAQMMIISNDGKPDQEKRRPVTERLDHWPLQRGDGLRDRRTVYVVFYNAAGYQVANGRVQDDILYDPHPPRVKSVTLRALSGDRVQLSVSATDRGSGLAGYELRSGKRVLLRRSRLKHTERLKLTRRPRAIVLTVHDRAGNTTRAQVRVKR